MFVCEDCPRNCKIDRDKTVGFCCVGSEIQIGKIVKNFMWEEPSLCFNKGVTAIFFSGCNLKCEFCQNEKISRKNVGDIYSIEDFARLLEKLDTEDTDGLDLISPTQFTTKLLQVFKLYKPKHKMIWNSNGYEKEENIEKLAKYIDVFLPDFKYYDNDIAIKLSQAPNYREVCLKAIKKMYTLKPIVFENEEMKRGVIVRHLILPKETDDSKRILQEIKNNFPDVYVSLMSQFLPNGKGEKNRKLYPLEYKIVVNYFQKIGLKNGYFQELQSADENFVPNF